MDTTDPSGNMNLPRPYKASLVMPFCIKMGLISIFSTEWEWPKWLTSPEALSRSNAHKPSALEKTYRNPHTWILVHGCHGQVYENGKRGPNCRTHRFITQTGWTEHERLTLTTELDYKHTRWVDDNKTKNWGKLRA